MKVHDLELTGLKLIELDVTWRRARLFCRAV